MPRDQETSAAAGESDALNAGDRSLIDTFLVNGLTGSRDFDALFGSIRSRHLDELASLKREHESEIRQQQEHIDAVAAEVLEADQRLREIDIKRRELEEQLRKLDVEREKARLEQERILASLRAHRADYPIRLIRRRNEVSGQLTSDASERFLTNERRIIDFEKEMIEVARARRDLNQEEYQRRAELLASYRADAQVRFTEQETLIRNLRKLGVTRTISGFLVYVGYLSFPIFGWFLGTVLEAIHQPPKAPELAGLLGVFMIALKSAIGRIGLMWGLLGALVVPLALLGVFVGILYLTDVLLRRFDARWSRSTPATQKSQRGEESILGWLSSRIQTAQRTDYTQLIAKLPVFYAIATLVMIFAVLVAGSGLPGSQMAALNVSGSASAPWQTVVYTSFGTVMCIVLAGFTALYATRLIEPRYRKLLLTELVTWRQTAAVNVEILVVAIAIVLVTAGSEIASHSSMKMNAWSPGSTAGILAFAFAVAFSVAYGLMFRGAFRDYDVLQAELRMYDRELQRYVSFPVIEDIDEQVTRFKNDLRSLHDEIERTWNKSDDWLAPLFALSHAESGMSAASLLDLFRPTSWKKNTFSGAVNADALFEPQLFSELATAKNLFDQLDYQMETARRTIQELQTEETSIKSDHPRKTLDQLRKDLLAALSRHRSIVSDLRARFHRFASDAENAFQIGVHLRRDFRNGDSDFLNTFRRTKE